MEIASADGQMSALFTVDRADPNTASGKSELIHKYGNRYFLAKFYDAANGSASRLPESTYEKKVSGNADGTPAEEHVAAHHRNAAS